MRIQDIPKVGGDKTVYVVGTGASLRCLPLGFFGGKTTIGLNQAWKHLPCTYSITVHPDLFLEWAEAIKPAGRIASRWPKTQWVIKRKPPMERLRVTDPHHYVFDTSYDLKTVTDRPKDVLYLGEGVQTTAMDLAARMGAAAIILVGCDAKALGGDYHAHDQHVRWVGRRPEDQYKMYRDSAADVRLALRGVGVSVMTLSPFIGVDAGEEDYLRLRGELGLDRLPEPKDVSPPGWKPPKR